MDAPPVVLLHGWGGTFATTWGRSGWPRELAAAGRSVVTVDLPGHGGPAPHDPDAYRDLARMLDARLPDGVLDVIAFSLGAKLALAIAASRPGRFRKMALGGVGDNLFAPEPSGEIIATALTHGISDATPAAVVSLVNYASVPGNAPGALAAILRRPANPVVAERDLANADGVLLVNGDADIIAIPDERLRRALRLCRAVRLSGIDHLSLPDSREFRDLALAHISIEPKDRLEEL